MFEITKEGIGSYIIKLPLPKHLKNGDIDIYQKVQQEILTQKQFILRYEELIQAIDKALRQQTSQSTKNDLYASLI